MTSPQSPSAADPPAAAGEPCRGCNGAGHIVVSLCCGRGCATCVGDQLQAVACYGCKGSGVTTIR